MDEFNALMQKYVNTDYDVLVSLAREAVHRLSPHCRLVDPEHNGNFMLASLILVGIGADRILTELEKKMLKDVLGLDNSGVQQLIGMYNDQMEYLVNHFADNMGEETKADAIMLVCAFAAVDEKICKEETALIRKLFE